MITFFDNDFKTVIDHGKKPLSRTVISRFRFPRFDVLYYEFLLVYDKKSSYKTQIPMWFREIIQLVHVSLPKQGLY